MAAAAIGFGTAAWFEMVGQTLCEVAARSGLPPDLNLVLVERYSVGIEWGDGLVQGLRFEILQGVPSFRVGAHAGETGDIVIEIMATAARRLNSLRSTDPGYPTAVAECLRSGTMRIDGDLSQMGDWLATAHDPIVDRTA